ncbi:MAG: hypothetical protein IIA45_02265 [Bacteroidetes bacterium]|nr:hypothetical protein [Bacteroidota bacterium]
MKKYKGTDPEPEEDTSGSGKNRKSSEEEKPSSGKPKDVEDDPFKDPWD